MTFEAVQNMCLMLGSNDPSITRVGGPGQANLATWKQVGLVGLSLVAGNNSSVKELVIATNHQPSESTRLDALLKWVGYSGSLEKVALIGLPGSRTALPMCNIIRAICTNKNAHRIYLMCMNIDFTALVPLFKSHARLRYLYLRDCHFAQSDMPSAIEAFRSTKAANVLGVGGFDSSEAPILRSVAQNSHISRFHLRSASIHQSFWSSFSRLGYLSLVYVALSTENMQNLAAGLKANVSIQTLALRACTIVTETFAYLRELMKQCPHIRELELGESTIPGEPLSDLLSVEETGLTKLVLLGDAALETRAVMAALSSPSSKLTNLELKGYSPSVGRKVTYSMLSVLPMLMRLRSLEFFIPPGMSVDKAIVLRAFERNGSLTRIKLLDGGQNIFSDHDKDQFQHYVTRNRRIPHMLSEREDDRGSIKTKIMVFYHACKSITGLNLVFRYLLGTETRVFGQATVGTKLYPERKDQFGYELLHDDPTSLHVRFGRGNCNTKHPGNQRLFALILRHQPDYHKARTTKDKRAIINTILLHLENAGMRFVDRDKVTGHWFMIPCDDKRIYKRVAQSLRDDHTTKGRRDKRKRHHDKQETVKKRKKQPNG